jgi:hypothetical protein
MSRTTGSAKIGWLETSVIQFGIFAVFNIESVVAPYERNSRIQVSVFRPQAYDLAKDSCMWYDMFTYE